jgi:hypothetical protein
MAVYDPPISSYSDTNIQIRVIGNVIQLIDPVDTPLLAAVGGLDAARVKFQVGQNGKKIEILEDEYEPVASTLNNGGSVTTNATQFTVTDASILQDGSVLLIDNEYLVVKAVDLSTNVVTIYSRAYGGTNSTHATTAAFSIVGMARLEGDDTDYIGLLQIANPYNYTGIFQKGLSVTGTEQAIDQYAIDDMFAYQSRKKIPELMRKVEQAMFHGIRAAGDAANPRSFGGLGTFITDNVTTTTTTLAKGKIDDVMELIYLDGGAPDLLVVHPSVARDLKDTIDTSSFVQVGLDVDTLGTRPLRRVSTQYGDLGLLMSRWCPSGTAYILTSRKVGLYTLRPFGWKRLGLTGDSIKGEVVGEFSMLVANDKAHGKITGITT